MLVLLLIHLDLLTSSCMGSPVGSRNFYFVDHSEVVVKLARMLHLVEYDSKIVL